MPVTYNLGFKIEFYAKIAQECYIVDTLNGICRKIQLSIDNIASTFNTFLSETGLIEFPLQTTL